MQGVEVAAALKKHYIIKVCIYFMCSLLVALMSDLLCFYLLS